MNRRHVGLLAGLIMAQQLMPPSFAASQPELNFKIYSPESSASAQTSGADTKQTSGGALTPKADDSANAIDSNKGLQVKTPADSMWSSEAKSETTGSTNSDAAQPKAAATPAASDDTARAAATDVQPATPEVASKKTLKGYIRVVPSGTKIPIIMDTAVDSDTSQEGDEFSARTGEDLNIDGQTIVPAGSVIKGRIAQLNSPKSLGRSGSVALKFDTVTTPDNRQIPLVANLVAHGGVVHAKRGMKDIALDTGTLAIPTAIGLGIGALAGSSGSGSGSSHISKPEAAMIGAGIGVAIGVAVLCIKKGKKVDVRPGDELKIELAEDLRMPI